MNRSRFLLHALIHTQQSGKEQHTKETDLFFALQEWMKEWIFGMAERNEAKKELNERPRRAYTSRQTTMTLQHRNRFMIFLNYSIRTLIRVRCACVYFFLFSIKIEALVLQKLFDGRMDDEPKRREKMWTEKSMWESAHSNVYRSKAEGRMNEERWIKQRKNVVRTQNKHTLSIAQHFASNINLK